MHGIGVVVFGVWESVFEILVDVFAKVYLREGNCPNAEAAAVGSAR